MQRPLLSFYGDDLTGSTDAMEALSLAGFRTALFLKPATDAQMARLSAHGPLQALGLAGTSRSETPEWMDVHLPVAFSWLKQQQASVCHYKVCSTFDSATHVGNIGRALEIGAATFAQKVVPIVVGVPQLKRFTVFGNLFATMNGITYRIDRHPVMSRHPVTPAHESDLRVHLAAQTTAPIGLVDWQVLTSEGATAAIDLALDAEGKPVQGVVLDVADRATQSVVGEHLWRKRGEANSLFVVGSSGVEYALVEAWKSAGIQGTAPQARTDVGPVGQIAVVSGSCSEVTARQIRASEALGFALVALDAGRLASRALGDAEQARALALAQQALQSGQSVIAYTALGPDSMSTTMGDAEPHAIGQRLGRLLRDMVVVGGLKRAVVAGGDTSSHALRELDVFALTIAMPLPRTPGSPLCTVHSEEAAFEGLQLAFKGGQIGDADYFAAIRDGRK